MSFQDFGLAEPILRAVLMEGYTEATPIQSQAIGPVLEGKDVIGCAQTGTGKTAAFTLPLLHRLVSDTTTPHSKRRPIRALVLASTRELASQIRESVVNYGAYCSLRSTAIFGGVSQGPQERALYHGIDVLVATPGRLLDLIQQGFVDLSKVQCLVLDEADRMLDMGFLPAIRAITRYVPTDRQTLLFSATMPEPIVELANSILRDPVRVTIEPKRKTTDLVEQSIYHVPQKQKLALLLKLIEEMKPKRALVFTRTKYGADRVAKHLLGANIRAEAIHSNKSQNKRLKILESFKWQNPPILVATDIASRGIDVDMVSHVFNFDLPMEPETYVHRIGRTGRAGASGLAISFCDYDERKVLHSIEKLLGKRIPHAGTIEPPAEERRDSRPRGDRSNSDRSRSDRTAPKPTRSDRQNSERPDSDRRSSDRPSSDRPSSDRSSSERSEGGDRGFGKRRFKGSRPGGKPGSRPGAGAKPMANESKPKSFKSAKPSFNAESGDRSSNGSAPAAKKRWNKGGRSTATLKGPKPKRRSKPSE